MCKGKEEERNKGRREGKREEKWNDRRGKKKTCLNTFIFWNKMIGLLQLILQQIISDYWIATMTLYREQFYDDVFNNFKDHAIASVIG